MNSAIDILRREREAAAEEAKGLRVRIKELDAAIALLDAQATQQKSGPKGDGDLNSQVLDILAKESAGLIAKDIAAKLTQGGRPTGDASVSSTLSRLKSDGKVRNDRGVWFVVNEAPTDDWANPSEDWGDSDNDIAF